MSSQIGLKKYMFWFEEFNANFSLHEQKHWQKRPKKIIIGLYTNSLEHTWIVHTESVDELFLW